MLVDMLMASKEERISERVVYQLMAGTILNVRMSVKQVIRRFHPHFGFVNSQVMHGATKSEVALPAGHK